MSRKKKRKIELRYYQMPIGSPILALLGEKWIQIYGRNIDYLHFHNFLEIGYCYDGNGTITLGESEYRFEGENFTVIPPNYPHTTVSDADVYSRWEYLFIDVEGFLRENSSGRRGERITQQIYSQALIRRTADFPKIARMILHIMDIMRKKEEYYLEEARGVLAALLVNIARENKRQYERVSGPVGKAILPEDGTVVLESRSIALANRAMDYIALHYMEQMKVDELADWCHISEAHLRRLFSTYIKMSPLEYINLARIRVACEYLKATDDPVADIAHKCGFPVLSTFNRNFKQILGVSPHEWRKRPENYEQQILKFEIHSEEGW